MVHTGKPSRGCDVCRRRRIKCDEAEPSCSYCVKRRIQCPGYKAQFDLAWRDQNQVAEKSVRRRKNAIESAERHVETHQLRLSPPKVPRVLSQDFAGYALDFFFSYYICLPKDPDIQRGYLECLFPMWTESSLASPLRPIVTAVASVMLDAWSQVKPDQPGSISRAHYNQGITALRQSLLSSADASNEVIMASLMLDMYENLLSYLTARRNKGPHISGTTAMIESRRRTPVTDETSQRMILGTRAQVVNKALSSAESVSPVVTTWSKSITSIPPTPGFRLDELNIEIANLQASASRLASGSEIPVTLFDSTLKQAIELDRRLSSWTQDLPTDWVPTRVSGPKCIPQSVQDAGVYQDSSDVYKTVFIADTFNAYHISRIKLQVIITTCLEHVDITDLIETKAAALQSMQDSADSICASVPFHLGDRMTPGRLDDVSLQFPCIAGHVLPPGHSAATGAFAGFLLSAKLAELLSPRVVLRPGQKQWVGGQLGRMKRMYIIRPS